MLLVYKYASIILNDSITNLPIKQKFFFIKAMLFYLQKMTTNRYNQRGVSADKEDVHNAIKNIDVVKRQSQMKLVNPKYVLRNYMAQLAIDAADKEDYSVVSELFELLKKPYNEQPENSKWFAKRPDWARHKVGCSMLSCSS